MSIGSSRLIQASAGTGKTYALSGQFISLILAGEDPSSILASTFTRKAAGEILERIYIRLARAVLDQNSRQELATQTSNPTLTLERVSSALSSLIENQHQLKVSTLDAFASSVARLFAEEIGLPAAWSVQDEPATKTQLSFAIAAVCSSLKSKEIASLVTTLRGGESSRSISNAINNIVGALLGIFQETDFAAWDWLKVDRPDASIKVVLKKCLLDSELPKTKAGEINKTVFKAHQVLLNLVEKEDWSEVVATTLVQNVLKEKFLFSNTPLPQTMVDSILGIANYAATYCLFRLGDANRAAYGLLFAVINELLLAEDSSGKISFERITRRIVQLGHSLFSDELYFRLDSKIHHVLLDEFQDTSLLQWQLLEPLVDEKLSSLEVTSSFFCVGDGKQAIYGWRGGTTAIFDSIPKRWSHIDLQTREKSFRSEPEIISAVNTVFSSLQENSALSEFSAAINNWLTRFNLHSTVLSEKLPMQIELAGQADAVKFESIEAEVESDEYSDCLFFRLNQITKDNPNSSLGILVRNNEEISHLLDLAQNYNFNLSAQGGTPLTRFPLITSILALLSLINNPGNKIKEYEVLASPWIGSSSIEDLINKTKESIQKQGLALALQEFTQEQTEIFSGAERKAFGHLLSLAIKEQTSESLVDLPAFIRLVQGSSVEDISDSMVQVLTIHKSKGLEFDIVVIPDLSWSMKPKDKPDYLIEREPISLRAMKVSLPGTQALRAFSPELASMAQKKLDDDFEEALSLLYVALTRARSKMYLFTPGSDFSSSSISAASLIAFKISPQKFDTEAISFDESLLGSYHQVLEDTKLNPKNSIASIKLKTSNQKLRGLGRISPSTFIEHGLVSDKTSENELFGTLIHKLFSLTLWVEENLDEKLMIQELKVIGANASQAGEAISAFRKFLELDSVSSIMHKPSRQELNSAKVYTEKPFIYREGNALVQGRIDRLVVTGTSGLVVDFKVGKTPSPESGKLAGYMKQLECYSKAASILFPSVKFKALLLFLGDGQVESLSTK